jgi:hypothetical protein
VEKAAFVHFGIRLKDEAEPDASAQQSREQSAVRPQQKQQE